MNTIHSDSEHSSIKKMLDKINPLKLNFKNKIRFFLILILIIVLSVAGMISLSFTKTTALNTAKEALKTTLKDRQSLFEEYFQGLQTQLSLISSSNRTITALKELDLGFSGIQDYGISSNEKLMNKLLELYSNELVVDIQENTNQEFEAENLLPKEPQALFLQYFYIAENIHPKDKRYELVVGNDNSDYSYAHQEYHPFFKNILLKLQLDDIYLVNNKGDVVYSANKKYDLGTNLNTGTFSQSALASVFKASASAINSSFIKFGDYSFYYPKGYRPACFVSTPIVQYSENIGVLIFEISNKAIQGIIHQSAYNQENNGYHNIETKLYGIDQLYRSNTFSSELASDIPNKILAEKIKAQNSNILLEKVPKFFSNELQSGTEGILVSNNRLSAYNPVQPYDLNWGMLLSLPLKYVFTDLRRASIFYIVASLALILLVLIITKKPLDNLTNKILNINRSARLLAQGEFSEDIKVNTQDEVGLTAQAINNLVHRISDASNFALKLGKGEFDFEFIPKSDQDQLGLSMAKMKESLQHALEEEERRKQEDEIRNFVNDGIAKFNDLLRQDNDNLEKLSYNLIKELLEYTEITMGAFFMREGESEAEYKLRIIAAHAYDRRKFLQKDFEVDEGLLGMCYLEKKTIYLKEIPEDHVEIITGIGQSKPRTLLIVPLKMEEEVLGVIELGALKELKPYEIEFIEKIAAKTASTLISVRLNLKTHILLEEAKNRESELVQQEEEMRQNLEELKATQEEMNRIKKEEEKKEAERKKSEELFIKQLKEQNDIMKDQSDKLKEEKMLLDALLNHLPATVYFKDKDSKFIRISESMTKLFKAKSADEIIGKSDFDFQGKEHAQEAYEGEQKIIKTGKPIIDLVEKEEFDDGRVNWVTSTKMPLKDNEGTIIGTFGVSTNITELKLLEEKYYEQKRLIEKIKEAGINIDKFQNSKDELNKDRKNKKR